MNDDSNSNAYPVVNININIHNNINANNNEEENNQLINLDILDLINLFCDNQQNTNDYMYMYDTNSNIRTYSNNDGVYYIDIYTPVSNENYISTDVPKKKRELEKKYNISKYYKCKEDNIECSICVDTISKKEYIRKLNCGHKFHKKCVDTWLIYSLSCPMCRETISPIETINTSNTSNTSNTIETINTSNTSDI